jgi:hypothetical protein
MILDVDEAKLTVRLRDQRLYGLLKLLAAHRGISMNRLVEEALARELELEAARTERELVDTLELLRSYRAHDDELAQDFAQAEVSFVDPLRSEPPGAERGEDARDPLGALGGFDRAA